MSLDITTAKSPAAQFRTGFWDSPRREKLSSEKTFLLFYLLTSPYRHPSGIFQLNLRQVTGHLGWDRQQTEKVLTELNQTGEVLLEDGWVFVVSWLDHNNPPGPGIYQSYPQHIALAPSRLVEAWKADAIARGMAINQWLNVSNGTRGGTREGGTPPGTPSSTAPTTQGRTGVTVNQLTPNKTTTNSGGGLRQEEIQEYVEAALWLQNQSPKGIGNETKLRQSIATRIKRSGPTERDKEDLATFKRHMDKAQRSKADAHAHAERAEELRRQEIRQREIEEGILGTLIQGGPGIRSLLIEAAIDNAVPIAKKTLIRQRAKFVEQGTVDEMDPIARSFLRQAAATHGNEYKAA